MTDSALINKLYTQLGIKKSALAGLLHIHHSILSRIEADTRPLPLKATVTLANMFAALTPATPIAAAEPTEENNLQYEQKAAWCLVQIQLLQRHLEKVKVQYQQAHTMLAFIEKYTKNNTLTAKEDRWCLEQKYQADKKMKINGWEAQEQLLLKMALLQTEAAFYQKAKKAI